MQTTQDFAGSTDMWSTSAGGHLMKMANLTGFTVIEERNTVIRQTGIGLAVKGEKNKFSLVYCEKNTGKINT